MAQTKVKKPEDVVERNLRLTEAIMRYLLENPQVFDALPDDFELIILPDDDPDVRLYNLDLLDRYGSEGRPVVLARVRSKGIHRTGAASLSLFAPIPSVERARMARRP